VAQAPHIEQLFSANAANPIPEGLRVNNTIYAPHLIGIDPAAGRLDDDALAQMRQALRNMQSLLERAGASLDNVGRVVGYVSSLDYRDPIYGPWDDLYPDSNDIPAFKVLRAELPPGVLVSLSMFALVGGRRQRFDIPGVPARDPTVRVGSWVFSSRVHGTDPEDSKTPEDGDAQAELAFGNLRRLIEIAGGKPSDINQVTAFIRDPANAALAQRHFEQAFPEAERRPKLWILDAFIRPHLALMAELVAKVEPSSSADASSAGDGERIAEIFARPEADPIAEAVRLGPVLYAPALDGRDPSNGRRADDFEGQLRQAVRNLHAMLARAGSSLAEVMQVTVFMSDPAANTVLNTIWSDVFPDAATRPRRVDVRAALPKGDLVRLQVLAAPGGPKADFSIV
jgi:enamine deaminase RidA (YjgF/YER057c/UK114 family)